MTSQRPLVLVADDDPDILALVAFGLERAGYETVRAPDGGKALELAGLRRPDVAVVDLMMPRVDGCEVVRQLRQSDLAQTMVIIVLTAFAEDAQVAKGLAAGADVCLKKPFSPRELANLVGSLLDERNDGASEGAYGVAR